MTSSIKEEDVLRDVIIIMSQQLPDTDLYIKLGCLFILLKAQILPLPLTQVLSAFILFFPFIFLCLRQKHLREVTPFSNRKGLWRRRVSGLFFRQTDRQGKGGEELFSCCGDKRSLLLFCPLPQRWICLSAFF